MSAKISAARRAAFLKALESTGNLTLAAERAKVSRNWAMYLRRRDPGFDGAVRAALRLAQDRLVERAKAALTAPHPAQPRIGSGAESPSPPRGRGSNKPPSGWRHLDGGELVVRGTGDGGGASTGSGQAPRRRVQIARARLKQWDARTET